jgi:PIN domain nuclease of toxin-antitoxin system
VVLLDTHAILWFDTGAPMAPAAIKAIEAARQEGGVLVSPVSAWELGTLAAKGRISFATDAAAWLARFIAQPGVRLTPLTVSAAARSSALPGTFHGDPADRLLVESARELETPLVTRDRRILDYARARRYIRVIRC